MFRRKMTFDREEPPSCLTSQIYILSAKHATSYTQVNVLEIILIFIFQSKISGRYVSNTKALPVQIKSPLGLVNVFHFILF